MSENNVISGHAIFCDDLRLEVTGKQIFVGVYTGDMMVPSFPIDVVISVWARIYGLNEGEHTFVARIYHDDEEKVIEGGGRIDDENRPLVMAFPGSILHVRSAGKIKFDISFDGGPRTFIGELPVLQDPQIKN